MNSKSEPEVIAEGFCCGCRKTRRLVRVSQSRYRCGECAALERQGSGPKIVRSEFYVLTPIPEDRICALLICAWEGGSHYWARAAGNPWREEKKEGQTTGLGDFHLALPIEVDEMDDDGVTLKTHTLDHDKIRKGLAIMATEYPRHWSNFMIENEDAECGDVFLQCCLFGTIVYG